MRMFDIPDRLGYRRMTTEELRSRFVVENLFRPGKVELAACNLDRAVIGGILPLDTELELGGCPELACSYFCERREAGIVNLGGPGSVVVDGTSYDLATRDALYIPRGSRGLLFSSVRADHPACFYLVSYPAHTDCPTTQIAFKDAGRIELGSTAEANRRVIHPMIHPGLARSCQLTLGMTEMRPGSVWNSFPPHTHPRRSEIYCYFDLAEDRLALHLLGEPDETRHVVLRDRQAVLSPDWSLHCGVGVGPYAFVWAMGGENLNLEDIEKCDLSRFR